jgi:hypothetical protein
MLRIPHCLDNWLIDGGKVVSPTHRPHFTPQKHFFNASGTHYESSLYRIFRRNQLEHESCWIKLVNHCITEEDMVIDTLPRSSTRMTYRWNVLPCSSLSEHSTRRCETARLHISEVCRSVNFELRSKFRKISNETTEQRAIDENIVN